MDERRVTEAEDVQFVDVRGPRDDDVPFGPEFPEHVLAKPEQERRKRRIKLGAFRPVLEKTEGAGQDLQNVVSTEPDDASESTADERFAGPEELVERQANPNFASRIKARLSMQRGKGQRSTKNFPIRVLIGYLPEVTEKDALSFALGVADKHVENIENAHYDAFKFQDGFVYEVHEGGTGSAFTPSILEYFEGLGPFNAEADARMHIRTATRTVEVIRKPSQVEAVLLPESAGLQSTPEPAPGSSMRPAMNKRTGVLVAGATVFITGFFAAIIIGSFMRLVPADSITQPAPQKIDVNELPAGQWAARLQNVQEGKYVRALRYNKNAKLKWVLETADISDPSQQPAPDAAGPLGTQGGN